MRRSEKGNPLDLRVWLEEARKLGEVRDVRGADWNLELGAISELNVKKDAPPASILEGRYEINVSGQLHAARPYLQAPYDPRRYRILR